MRIVWQLNVRLRHLHLRCYWVGPQGTRVPEASPRLVRDKPLIGHARLSLVFAMQQFMLRPVLLKAVLTAIKIRRRVHVARRTGKAASVHASSAGAQRER